MRRVSKSPHYLLALFLLFTFACNIFNSKPVAIEPQTSSQQPTETQTNTVAPTATTTLSLTLEPTPSPIRLSLNGPSISYEGIEFSLDQTLGNQIFVLHEPDWFNHLDGIRFTIAEEGYGWDEGFISIHPVEQYRTLPWGEYNMDNLQLEIVTESYDYFPQVGSAILLQAKTKHIKFSNGAGILAIVANGQNGFFVSNDQIQYQFHGLTKDGLFYVFAGFPIDAPFMMSSSDPSKNTNPDAILAPDISRDSPDWGPTMIAYNNEIESKLDNLNGALFTPELDILDSLFESLSVTHNIGK